MTTPGVNLGVDGARLWDSIMAMAKIGPGVAGGNNRQTLTDAVCEGLCPEVIRTPPRLLDSTEGKRT